MEENKLRITLTCKHGGCGKNFQVQVPPKAGIYQVKCPDGHVNRIQFVQKNIHLDEMDNERAPHNTVTCPWSGCRGSFKFETSDDGVKTCRCPHCGGAVRITVDKGKIMAVERKCTTPIEQHCAGKGQLTLVRYKGFFGKIANKSYTLHIGRNTIGRYDENLPCDIEIHGDTYASRRSVVIEVISRDSGLQYRMTILKATNPVMHNHRPLVAGEVVYLNYGDCIQLGRTMFNFEKA